MPKQNSGLVNKFKMKTPPKKPERGNSVKYIPYRGKTLSGLIEHIKGLGYEISDINFSRNYCYINTNEWMFVNIPESDESYNRKLSEWNKKMNEYKEWKEQNKESIAEYEREKQLKEIQVLEKQKTKEEKAYQQTLKKHRDLMNSVEKIDDKIQEKKKKLGLV